MKIIKNDRGEVVHVRVTFREIRDRVLALVALGGQKLAEGVVLELDADGRFLFENVRSNDLDLKINGECNGKQSRGSESPKVIQGDFFYRENGGAVRGRGGPRRPH